MLSYVNLTLKFIYLVKFIVLKSLSFFLYIVNSNFILIFNLDTIHMFQWIQQN